MPIHTLEDLYVQQLRDMHHSETQLCGLLAGLQDAAGHKDLNKIFGDWVEQGLQRRHMLEQILGELDHDVGEEAATPLAGIIQAGLELVGHLPDQDMRDTGLIAVAQRIAHYREAGYRALVPFALVLKRKHDQAFIETAARISREAGEQLSQLATRTIHRAATASYQMAS